MGSIRDTGRVAFRPYVVDGVPSSGANEPDKSQNGEIHDFVDAVDTAVENLISSQAGGGLAYSTKSDLDADLAHTANQSAQVFADPTPALNGVYKKVGGSGSGSWTKIGELPAPLASPAFTGTPTAPTAAPGTSTTQIATTAHVAAADALKADKAVTVTGGGLATGGGDLSANRTITVTKSTAAQVLAGTDDVTAVTPLSLAAMRGTLTPFPTYAAALAAGMASAPDGTRFSVLQAFGVATYDYILDSGDIVFDGMTPYGNAGYQYSFDRLALEVARNLNPILWDIRPQYEYIGATAKAWDGRLVLNTGSLGDDTDPFLTLLPGAGPFQDNDGSYVPARVTWAGDVVDPEGNNEAVIATFTVATQHLTFFYNQDINDAPLAAVDITQSIYVKTYGAQAGALILGSSSDGLGVRTSFSSTGSWVEHTVTNPGYSDAALFSLVLRPQAGAVFPFSVAIYGNFAAEPQSGLNPTLAAIRLARRAGHAHAAPIAVAGAIELNDNDFIVPSLRTPNLIAELTPEVITRFSMSAWIDETVLSAGGQGNLVGFPRIESTAENPHNNGELGIFGEGESEEYKGRVAGLPDLNTWKQNTSPTVMDGTGLTHIHFNFGEEDSDVGIDVHELFINGIPQYRQGAEFAIAAGFAPKLLSLGGVTVSNGKATQNGSGNFASPFNVVRYRPNRVLTAAEVQAEIIADLAAGVVDATRFQRNIGVLCEGDSTDDFSGGPFFAAARELKGPGRIFTIHALGGSLLLSDPTGATPPGDLNGDYIGVRRRAMRMEALRRYVALGYPTFTLWRPGENDLGGAGVLSYLDPLQDGIDALDLFILDDRDAADGGTGLLKSIFVLCKTSWYDRTNATSVFRDQTLRRHEAYCVARRAEYSVVDSEQPLLRTKPAGVGRRHDYLIDMAGWTPTDGVTTYNSTTITAPSDGLPLYLSGWSVCVKDASDNVGNNIVSADGQHFTGGENPHTAAGVIVPCLERIFELEGLA